ncbi:mucin-5AC-like [Ambystoma mexicanum]|uniref:mucin-5AC-like n=1 Tax=Ambystoma mexicanum TaxID=8296 RepID=UPI0037E8BBC0
MRTLYMTQLFAYLLAVCCTGGYTSDGHSPIDCWTRWFDHNLPNGQGESELLSELRTAYPGLICADPIGIEAETTQGLSAQDVKNTIRLNASVGLICLNKDQLYNPCKDYRVKFQCTGDFCTACQTKWMNSDTTTGNMGDYELRILVLQKYPLDACMEPIAIQAETVNGNTVSSTGDVIKAFDAFNGFACVNKDQNGRFCQDYQVRFTCSMDFCAAPRECQTAWLNSDKPHENSIGDNETIAHVRNKYPHRMCERPTSIEALAWSSLSALLTRDVIRDYDVSYGFLCLDADQHYEDCFDYSVKFSCPPSFCSGCRTSWLNRDKPTKNGDFETFTALRNDFPGKICAHPIGIEAQTVSGIPASQTGNIFGVYDATFGFACINKNQRAGTSCQDYMVRFTCPIEFCSGKRSFL